RGGRGDGRGEDSAGPAKWSPRATSRAPRGQGITGRLGAAVATTRGRPRSPSPARSPRRASAGTTPRSRPRCRRPPSRLPVSLVDLLAAEVRRHHLRVEDLRRGDGHDVGGEDGEVGPLARLEAAHLVLHEGGVGGVEGETAEGLLAREPLVRVPAAGRPALGVLAGDGGVEAEEGVDAL